MKAEYSQRPERYEVIHISPSLCEVLLREDVKEVEKVVDFGLRTETMVLYIANEYRMLMPYRTGLEDDIRDNFDAWIEAVRKEEADRLSKEIREHRNALLEEIDWTQTIDAPISAQSREKLRAYRQMLRDITEQSGFPYSVEWPKCPEVTKAEPDPVDEAFDVLIGSDERA